MPDNLPENIKRQLERNRKYWEKRFEILQESSLNKGEQYRATLDREYRTATQRIDGEIARWYQRFADNNQITLTEAKKWLSDGQLAELKWSVQDYIKYGEENALNGQWVKQLENASAKVHINRLDALKLNIQQNIEVLYGNQLDGLDNLARKVYSDHYYHTAFEVQKGFNVGWDLTPINKAQLDRVISKPWTTDGRTFSDRIWTQKANLVGKVQTELSQAILRGDSPDKAIKAIADEFRVTKNQAGRLVMTESAYFAAEAQKKCFNDLDVEQFQIVATLDSHTSEICQALDGTIEDMKNYEAGITAPPFHPWCRSCTIPYFDDNFGTRIARGADGQQYYIPSDMKYPEWKQKFIDGGDKGDLIPVVIPASGLVSWMIPQPEPPEPPPKKEYLTKKKLEQKILNAETEIQMVKDDFENQNNLSWDDYLDDVHSLPDHYEIMEQAYIWHTTKSIAAADYLSKHSIDVVSGKTYGNFAFVSKEYAPIQAFKQAQARILALEADKANWQKLLDEKLVKAEKKKLLKEQKSLQAQLDAIDVKTYSGIWVDDVTTAEWGSKQGSIQAKKDYFNKQINLSSFPADADKWQKLLDDLIEFEQQGQIYYSVQQKLKNLQFQLNNIGKTDILGADELYTQTKKDSALWAKNTKEADDVLRDVSGEVWRNASNDEQDAIFEYTRSYSKFNEPLRGMEYYTNQILGVGNVDLNEIGVKQGIFKKGEIKKLIDDTTSMIERSRYDFDMWVQRGVQYNGMDRFFGISLNDFNLPEQELSKLLVGTTPTDYAFGSSGVAKGKGFASKPIIFNIYAPRGTKMMYLEPFSDFGNGAKRSWDGISKQNSFGNESEILVQRGTTYRVLKVEKVGSKIFIDMEVIGQEVF